MARMTKAQAQAWMKRWRSVNRFLEKGWRQATPLEKFRDFLMLLDAAVLFPHQKKKAKEARFANPWVLLRKRFQNG